MMQRDALLGERTSGGHISFCFRINDVSTFSVAFVISSGASRCLPLIKKQITQKGNPYPDDVIIEMFPYGVILRC